MFKLISKPKDIKISEEITLDEYSLGKPILNDENLEFTLIEGIQKYSKKRKGKTIQTLTTTTLIQLKNHKNTPIDIYYNKSNLKFYVLDRYDKNYPITWPHNNVNINTRTLDYFNLPTSYRLFINLFKIEYKFIKFLNQKENIEAFSNFAKEILRQPHCNEEGMLAFIQIATKFKIDLTKFTFTSKQSEYGLLFLALKNNWDQAIIKLLQVGYSFKKNNECIRLHENGQKSLKASSVFCLSKFNQSKILEQLNPDCFLQDTGRTEYFNNGSKKSHTTSFYESIYNNNKYLLNVFFKHNKHLQDTGFQKFHKNRNPEKSQSTLSLAYSIGSKLIKDFPDIMFKEDFGEKTFYNNGNIKTHICSLYLALKNDHKKISLRDFEELTFGLKTFSEDNVESVDTIQDLVMENILSKNILKKLKKLDLL